MNEFDLTPINEIPYAFADREGNIYSTNPTNKWRGKLRKLTPFENGRGYSRVRIGGRHRLIHDLVALAFIGPRVHGLEVNHKDADKKNNRPENLEYVTRSANMKHCFTVGGRVAISGEGHCKAVLSDNELQAMINEGYECSENGRLRDGEAQRIARKYGVSRSNVWASMRGKGRAGRLKNAESSR